MSIFQTTQVPNCLISYLHLYLKIIGTHDLALSFAEDDLSSPLCCSCYTPRINLTKIVSDVASLKLQVINCIYGRMILNWHEIFQNENMSSLIKYYLILQAFYVYSSLLHHIILHQIHSCLKL